MATVNGVPAVQGPKINANMKVSDEKGRKKPFLIGVAGGTCCGKVSVEDR